MLRVFLDHQEVANYPETYQHQPQQDGGLLVVDESGRLVESFPAGSWHGAGTGVLCAGAEEREDCPNCHPPARGEG